MINKQRGKRVVKIFSIASFLNDTGSDMIYPIWPVFVTQILGANMAVLGLIDGALWDKISFRAPFYFAIGLTIAAILMILFVREEKRPRKINSPVLPTRLFNL